MTRIKRILVPTDFSAPSRAALAHALELRSAFASRVTVLHVHEPSGFVGAESLALMPIDGPGRRWEQLRQEILSQLQQFLGADRPAVHEVLVEAGVPADVIPAMARDGDFDLVLMGTHGQGPVSRLSLGTVADAVMRKAHCLVMTLRVPTRAAREVLCL